MIEKIKSLKSRQIIEILLVIAAIIMIAFVSYTIVGSAYYSVFRTDDFRHASWIGGYRTGIWGTISAALVYTKDVYMTWQGTYFSMILQGLFSPFNNYDLIQLHIVMTVFAVLLIVGFIFFIMEVSKKIIKSAGIGVRFFLAALLLFQFFNAYSYEEALEWFSGAVCYSVPVSMFFFSFGFYLIYEERKKKSWFILSSIMGFCAVGGSLTIVGTVCSIVLIYLLATSVNKKAINKPAAILFVIYLAGALINTLAPGNLVRGDNYEQFGNVKNALIYSKYYYEFEGTRLLSESYLKTILLIFVCVGIYYAMRENINLLSEIGTVIGLLIVPYITVFPVVLAYNSGDYYPNRCIFALHLSLTLMFSGAALILGEIVGKLLKKTSIRIAVMVLVLVLAGFLYVRENPMSESIGYIEYTQLKDGTVERYYTACARCWDEIKNSEVGDVILYDFPIPIDYFLEFLLDTASGDTKNQAIGGYYGKYVTVANYAPS